MPSSHPPVVQRQTLKQAKAAYKLRGQPAISEREHRQIQRAAELDERARRTREQEKRKAEALKKRAEKEKKEREERTRMQMGSQRRCDRFGYKSSQFHLGAFFGAGAGRIGPQGDEKVTKELERQDEDVFGDDGLDDESLLEAADSLQDKWQPTTAKSDQLHCELAIRQPLQGSSYSRKLEPAAALEDDFSSFWDALGSSTQIAREIDAEDQTGEKCEDFVCDISFGSAEFDFTVEELEELASPVQVVHSKMASDRELMPPPTLPTVHHPPNLGALEHKTDVCPIAGASRPPDTSLSKTCFPGFTLAELELYMDDDLQLTQAVSG
ncbi:hypothetical protein M433DRAFT_137891 [Acidomyces richmondensis BFW]|nr:MAG: hypothetical protein FE78DRAFT_33631 [Acidomyces sp. 'richmondensis']KYG41639.1 hypothetical protein M433DRAFT_137891 [Acidomyces richmondensis BFW]